MFPIRDRKRTKIFPFITYLILGTNLLVFLYMQALSPNELREFIGKYALFNQAISQGEMLHTLLTSVFLHGSIGHIFSNMLFLHIFGDNLEEAFGHFKFLSFYLICGIVASLTHFLINPTTTVPTLGASGAIAGLMGGYLVLFPNHKIDTLIIFGFFIRIISVPAVAMLLYWILFQFIAGLGSLGFSGAGGIAYFAHIGGFLAGVIITTISWPLINKSNR